jgi:hypothetical protein
MSDDDLGCFALVAFFPSRLSLMGGGSLFGFGFGLAVRMRQLLLGRGFFRSGAGLAAREKKLVVLVLTLPGKGVCLLVCFPLSQRASECLARKGNGLDKQTGNHWKVERRDKKLGLQKGRETMPETKRYCERRDD